MNLVFEKSPVARMTQCMADGDRIKALVRQLREGGLEEHEAEAIEGSIADLLVEMGKHQEQVKADLMTLARALPPSVKIVVTARAEGGAQAAQATPQAQAPSAPVVVTQSASMPLTDEQQEIVESGDRSVVINAYAGTGKTSTLIAYAAARPKSKGLYIAFNRGIAEEAQRRFGRNVTARTSHSLAFASCGRPYGNKLGNSRAREVAEFLRTAMRMPGSTTDEEYAFAQIAMNRVKDFFADGSMSEEIREEDTAEFYTTPSGIQIDGTDVTRGARALWGAMLDKDNAAIKLPHDGYLKRWVLSRPDLSQYDYLALDEAQDSNSCLLTMVEQQKIGKVLVGDRHQGIYGFRGSVNAMARMRGAKRFHLTKSFRFAQEVADVANSILSVFGGETRRLIGAGDGAMPSKPTMAHLHRTNAGLFASAVEWLEQSGEACKQANGKAPGLHFVGGVEGYQFDLITDAWRLKEKMNHAIQDPFVRRFPTYEHFEKYAEAVQDKELKARISIVEKFGRRVPELVAAVQARHAEVTDGTVQLCTAHRSKGLEWSEVVMADDFPPMMSDANVPKIRRFAGPQADADDLLPQEEANLYYVASTRARCELTPNKQLDQLLKWCANFPRLAVQEEATADEQ